MTACMTCNNKKSDKTLRQMGWKIKAPKVNGTGSDVCSCDRVNVAG